MKANNGSGNCAERDEWRTEQGFWNLLNDQYGFNFDCCATQKNSKCSEYSDDFLVTDIDEDDTCWMNPPFSKARKMFEHFFKVVKHGVAIYRCDNMETKIWQEVIFTKCSWIFIPDTRVIYYGMKGSGSRFPSALIGIGVLPPKNIQGTLIKVVMNK